MQCYLQRFVTIMKKILIIFVGDIRLMLNQFLGLWELDSKENAQLCSTRKMKYVKNKFKEDMKLWALEGLT